MKQLNLIFLLMFVYACDSDASVRRITSLDMMPQGSDMTMVVDQDQNMIMTDDMSVSDMTMVVNQDQEVISDDMSVNDMTMVVNQDQEIMVDDMTVVVDPDQDVMSDDMSTDDMSGSTDDMSTDDMGMMVDPDQGMMSDDMSTDDMMMSDDMGMMVDPDQGMVMMQNQPIHFSANLVQGAMKQSNGNTVVFGTISSGATLSQSTQYRIRAVINP